MAGSRSVVSLAMVVVAMWAVLPPRLGGRISYVVVSGRSMEPTYHTWDLAITYRSDEIDAADVIVYQVPAGQPGAGGQVIHRVIGGDGTRGYITQGDNREGPDIWRPTERDVIGKVVFLVPQGGLFLAMVFNLGNLGLVAVGFAVWAFWPRRAERGRAPATMDPVAEQCA